MLDRTTGFEARLSREVGSLVLAEFELEIHPMPLGRSEILDHEGNQIVQAWFEGTTSTLSVTSRFQAETTRKNAFDWLPQPHSDPLYPPAVVNALAPYLRITDEDPSVIAFADSIRPRSNCSALGLVTALNQKLFEFVSRQMRLEGHPQLPSETLARRRGACRDRAALFMEISRRWGIAARYVSGYQRFGHDHQHRYMHAWPEVYLPGGGWRGFHPTHGTAITDEHIAVAAAADPPDATPIDGSFFGDGQSEMMAEIEIHVDA